MSENVQHNVSLEDLVGFLDGEPTETTYRSANLGVDPTEGDPAPAADPTPVEPKEDKDPIEPVEPKPAEPTPEKDPEPVEPTPTEPTTKEPKPDGDAGDPAPTDGINYEALFSLLDDMGALSVGEDFEFDGTPEGIQEALKATDTSKQEVIAKQIWEGIPEDFRDAVLYGVNQGGSFEDYVKATIPKTLDQLDLDTKVDQRKAITLWYKETTQHSDEKIERLLDRLEASDALAEAAAESVEELEDIYAKRKKDVAATAAKAREAQIEEQTRWQNEIKDKIQSADFLRGRRKNKIAGFMFNPVTVGDSTLTG